MMADKVEAIKVYPGGRRVLHMVDAGDLVTVSRAIDQLKRGSAVYVTLRNLRELDRKWKPKKGDSDVR